MSRFTATLPATENKLQVRSVNIDSDYVNPDYPRRDPLADGYFGLQQNLQFFRNHRTSPTGFRNVGSAQVVPAVPVRVDLYPTQRTGNPIAVSLKYLGQVKPENSVLWGDEKK